MQTLLLLSNKHKNVYIVLHYIGICMYFVIEYGIGVCVPVFFRYYSIDAVVVREILGKKLASRTRKDLDDISELTTVPLRSCRRQVLAFPWYSQIPGWFVYLLSSCLGGLLSTS